jgi:hypothetical protein
MREAYFENEFAEFWIENDILFFAYKPQTRLDLAGAQRVVSDCKQFQKNMSYLVFCDARGLKEIDKAARDYLARDGSDLVIAVGILIESPVTRILTNFYLTISKPLTPTKLFTDRDEAIAYLNSYKSASI